ncbi:ArnT family glycosyltransferase [Thermoproteota archaeon]
MTLLLSFLLGFLFLETLAGDRQEGRDLRLAFALPLGMGISSLILFYTYLFLKEQYLAYSIFFHCVILLPLFLVNHRYFNKRLSFLKSNITLQVKHLWFGLAAVLLLCYSGVHITYYPYGHCDAFIMWNTKAKFMLYDSQGWIETLRHLDHPDYPLLLPLNIMWGWSAIGSDSFVIPILIELCVTFSILFIIFRFILRVTNYRVAILALFFAGTVPRFLKVAHYQYASMLIACYILITGICFLLAFEKDKRYFSWIGGLSVGAALFTKNEGLLLFVSLYFVLGLYLLFGTDKKDTVGVILRSLLACLPFLVTLFVFKKIINRPNDWISTSRIDEMLRFSFDCGRIKVILNYFLSEINSWSLFFYCLLVSVIIRFRFFFKGSNKIVTYTILLMSLGYFGVYLIIPTDLKWSLEGSLHRAMSHLFPLTAIWMFYCSFSDEKIGAHDKMRAMHKFS